MRNALAILLLTVIGLGTCQILLPYTVQAIPMRDGKTLAADLYLPNPNSTTPYPTILVQTPYNRIFYRLALPLVKQNLTGSAYAFVIVDWRCFYGSTGACGGNSTQGQDGYDVVQWVASQPWSNGRVGTWGASALGKVQLNTAKENPPALDCIVPLVAGSQFSYPSYYPGGMARPEYFEQLDALGFGLSASFYAHPEADIFWRLSGANTYFPEQIKVPAFLIGGWYDHELDLQFQLFQGLRTNTTADIRDKHRFLVGPWAHGSVGQLEVGQLFYPAAEDVSNVLALQFLDFYVRDIPNGIDSSPFFQYFQMGEDTWDSTATWPPVTDQLILYLHPDLSISEQIPTESTGSSSFPYDPTNPSPTIGGATLRQDLLQGPYDQQLGVENRTDVLIFNTEPLAEDLPVRGVITVELCVSSTGVDTDFVLRLIDRHPNGTALLVSDKSVQRMRYRNSYAPGMNVSMVPNQVYKISMTFTDIAITFVAGHRLSLDITSSNYPRFHRNANNGGILYPNATGSTLLNPITVTNSIHTNSINISRIILPVRPASPTTSTSSTATTVSSTTGTTGETTTTGSTTGENTTTTGTSATTTSASASTTTGIGSTTSTAGGSTTTGSVSESDSAASALVVSAFTLTALALLV